MKQTLLKDAADLDDFGAFYFEGSETGSIVLRNCFGLKRSRGKLRTLFSPVRGRFILITINDVYTSYWK